MVSADHKEHMKEKVVEILIYIMSEIRDNKAMQDIDLGDLKRRGYTQSEISAALSWLYDNMQVGEAGVLRPATRSGPGSRRILHEAEKFVIPTEGHGYLIQLRELGLLDDADLENVIERAMAGGFEKMSMVELQDLVSAVLFAKNGGDPGTRIMNNSKDTIH